MYRMIFVLLALLSIGCGTPSKVHLADVRTKGVTADSYFYYTDPTTTTSALAQIQWSYELAKTLEAVRTATNDDELRFAERQLDIIQRAKPTSPPKVQGTITNFSDRDFICYVYADESRTHRLGRVILSASVDPANGTIRTFHLPKGILAHFAYFEGGAEVCSRTLDNPADVGWQDWVR